VAFLPDFERRKIGNTSVWIAPKRATPSDLSLFAEADRLFDRPECEIVKDQRKIKVARLDLNLGGRTYSVYLKRFNCFSWRVKLGSFFMPSGAAKSLRGAAILSNAGISSAKPVAAVEIRSWGFVTKSFFITEEINGGKTVDRYWRGALAALAEREGYHRRRLFMEGLALLFRSLHEQGVYHNDLKDANILVVKGERSLNDSFFLLDLEGIRNYKQLSQRRRIKNLVQLNRTLGRYVRRAAKLYFLKHYLGPDFLDQGEKWYWEKKILRQSRRLDRCKLPDGALQ